MTYRGHIKNGRVVLKKRAKLPDGMEVEVEVTPLKATKPKPSARRPKSTMYEHYKDLIGKAKGLPPDAAINMDHYLYGLPKRK